MAFAESGASTLQRTTDLGTTESMAFLGWKTEPSVEEVILTEGQVIAKGDMVANLHFEIPTNKRANWQVLSLAQRAGMAASIALDDLIKIAELCASQHPEIDNIDAFYGRSHFVKRRFFEELGFTVRKPDPKSKRETRDMTEKKLWEIYDFDQGNEMRAERINEFWATKRQIIAALPMLRDRRDRIQARFLSG